MTSLAEAENKFGRVVRGAGGAIFGVERAPSFGGRQEEKLQIGTLDGFVKMAVLLNQPNINLVLRERRSVMTSRTMSNLNALTASASVSMRRTTCSADPKSGATTVYLR